MQEWQETYNWACEQADAAEMDNKFWWGACLTNLLVKALRGTKGIVSKPDTVVEAPTPTQQWKSALLTELYDVLYPGDTVLTVGAFKTVLEKVRPDVANAMFPGDESERMRE